MSRYFKESSIPKKEENIKTEPDVRVYNVDLKYAKSTGFNRIKSEGIDYHDRKQKAEMNDPFPGRKPVDKNKFKSHSRGQQVNVRAINFRLKQKEVERQEEILEFAAEQAARAEILLPEEAGYLEADRDQETSEVSQIEIRRAVEPETAAKSFDLNLDQFGPYTLDYTRNGKYLLIGGRRGHIAAFDWTSKELLCEINAMESVHSVKWLHTENMFAVAQKKWTYVYDNKGVEIHCLKQMNNVLQLEYLPYHFLLASSSEQGHITWLDVSLGKIVKETWTKQGRLGVTCQNPTNAVLCCGHSNGTVSMWTPNIQEPAAKLLAHGTAIRGITVDRSGTYMATSCVGGTLKIWDIRNYKCLHEYKLNYGANNIKFSQRNLLGVSSRDAVEIFKDPTRGDITAPYMKHKLSKNVNDIHFCPYEDVMGIGHGAGVTSILVPGCGEPNFDTLEANPYQTKKQRKEAEVQMLLDKVPYELITLDDMALTSVDAGKLQANLEEHNRTLYKKPVDIEFDTRKKSKGAKKHKISRLIIEQSRKAQHKIELAKEQTRERPEKKRKVYDNALDRFRPTKT